MKLTALLLFITLTATAQTTWNTYLSTPPKNPVITFTQFGDGWNVAITGTTAKYYLPNFKCTPCPVVVCPPPIDVKKSADYISLSQTLAQTIEERDRIRTQYDVDIAELTDEKRQLMEIIRILKAERAKYKTVQILVPKDSL